MHSNLFARAENEESWIIWSKLREDKNDWQLTTPYGIKLIVDYYFSSLQLKKLHLIDSLDCYINLH